MSSTIRTGLLATCIGLAICAAIAFVGIANVAPDVEVPIHWGLDGPDRFVVGSEIGPYFFMFPGIILGIAILLSLAPLLEPFRDNLVRSRKAYLATWLGLVALFILLQAGFVASATGLISEGEEMGRWVLAAVSALLIVIGNYVPKTRPNFLLGIRTPWTLTSPTAWEKTHRLGGPIFMLAGLAGLVFALAFGAGAGGVALATVLIPSAFGLVLYSWLVWRKSDDRRRPSDFIN